jgi:hypothetical protein
MARGQEERVKKARPSPPQCMRVLRAGVLRGVGSDAGGALLLVTKEREGLASSFGGDWAGAGLGWSPRLGGRRCYKVKRIGSVRD